jgi:hypothetical protein|tara:strand:+ start:342 stop:812 length:471 start_codon:yes stop_codon:yes gene_type:complete
MPRQKYTIRSFAGGVNTVKDPRDISENEASRIDNMSIDALGKIKSAGALADHRASPSSGGANLSKYISIVTASLDNRSDSSPGLTSGRTNRGGGFNLFYFESDHSRKNEFNEDSSQTFTVGASTGNIWFVNPQNSNVTGTSAPPSGDDTEGASSTL